jgi:hypothetical protein
MLRVRVGYTGLQGAPWLSTLYFAGNTQTEANSAITATKAFLDALKVWQDSNMAFATEAEVPEINTTTGATIQVFNTTVQTGVGSVGGTMLPTAAQALIRWRTGVFVSGREIRGRTFVPGLTQTANNGDGVVNGGTITAFSTAAANLIAAAGADFGVWSRARATFAAAQTGSCWNQFAVLRSRRD